MKAFDRHTLIILKWEIKKILSSWQKTLAIFLVPAAVMVFAINLFPKLLNYLTTGSFGSQDVIVIDAPESFIDYEDKKEDFFNYTYMSGEDFDMIADSDEDIFSLVKGGDLVIAFFSLDDELTFDEAVEKKVRMLYEEGIDEESAAYMSIGFNQEQFTSESKALQFEEDVANGYVSYVYERYASQYDQYSTTTFTVDDFNPITYILDNRSVANTSASRIIPAIMVILMYYCVYSLTCDMVAMEKNRGFLNKLIMTPVSTSTILWGKALAINILVTGSSVITFLFLFLSSWLNRSNDVGSLLPFGLMLMPDQLIYMILGVPSAVLVMTGFCFIVALELAKFEDTVANLQLVLLILLIGLFVQMFIFWSPTGLEYIIPVHNEIILLRDVLMSEISFVEFLVILAVNTGLGLFLMKRCTKKITGGKK